MLSIDDPLVERRIIDWLGEQGEVFVEVHQPHSGASGAQYFLRAPDQFVALRAAMRPKAVLIAHRARQFAWRGVIAPERIPELLALIPEGCHYALVDVAPYPAPIRSHGSGRGHGGLRADIEALAGMECGVGAFPLEPAHYWSHEGTETILVAEQRGRA